MGDTSLNFKINFINNRFDAVVISLPTHFQQIEINNQGLTFYSADDSLTIYPRRNRNTLKYHNNLILLDGQTTLYPNLFNRIEYYPPQKTTRIYINGGLIINIEHALLTIIDTATRLQIKVDLFSKIMQIQETSKKRVMTIDFVKHKNWNKITAITLEDMLIKTVITDTLAKTIYYIKKSGRIKSISYLRISIVRKGNIEDYFPFMMQYFKNEEEFLNWRKLNE